MNRPRRFDVKMDSLDVNKKVIMKVAVAIIFSICEAALFLFS